MGGEEERRRGEESLKKDQKAKIYGERDKNSPDRQKCENWREKERRGEERRGEEGKSYYKKGQKAKI